MEYYRIEEKLDQIIKLLININQKLAPIEQAIPALAPVVAVKPTKSMLKFQQMIEFAARMDRTHFLSAIRKRVKEMMEIRQHQPGSTFRFKPQFDPKIEEKIQKTGAQFYKDLNVWSENYARAVEEEGEKTLERAIARLKVKG